MGLIDFWASWCMPCMGEMPYANKIEEYYKGKDVVFLYISIDEAEDNWKKAITANHISGIHMRDTGAPKDKIARLYGVEGIPAYFLIDKKGNFGVGNVPHPSDEKKLKAEIDYLLK